MKWHGERLVVRIDERSAPWGSPVRGTVKLTPLSVSDLSVPLDPRGVHTWSPRIPLARVEVDFEEPRVKFEGTGYFDLNRGSAPLEDTFASWSWSRTSHGDEATIAYDVALRDGSARARAFKVALGGELQSIDAGVSVDLPSTRFGLSRTGRSSSTPMAIVRTLEDGPFYARSLVSTTSAGRQAFGMHETVSLDRFRSPWVRFLVPFRMRVEAA